MGTKLRMSSAYHPETDGQTEVVNRGVETYLRCFASERPRQWSKWLAWAEYCYNTSFHSAAKSTPFEIVYGRPPPKLGSFLPAEIKVRAVVDELEARDDALRHLREHLERAQQRMVHAANKHRRDVHFEVGQKVFLKLRPYRQSSLFRPGSVKLAAKFYGPFEVVKRIGPVAYQLLLPASSRLHPVFHISQLKAMVGTHSVETELPKELWLSNPEFVPQWILRDRWVWQGDERVRQLLVQWKDKGIDEATWVAEDEFRGQFPEFNLEDKVVWKEEGVVADRVYRRKSKAAV